jgi:DNA-binding NtrC family response regulator
VRGGRETILLVEDERTLRFLVRSILERYGYEVLEASSGRAALSLWQEHKDRIHLLFTDMVMPDGICGRELAQDLLRERPGLKVIFTSGYSAEVIARDLSLEAGFNFLQKPYDPRMLASMVRTCLDEPANSRSDS